MIDVERLVKHFRVHRREPGLGHAIRSLVHRSYATVRAVDGLTFEVQRGEIVGLLGRNGAGKTTTLKCLSGLLHPTSGTIRVFGRTPHRRERELLRGLAFVMGSRNRLLWDLPAVDTFQVNRAIYEVPTRQYRESVDELVELLELAPFLHQPVRNLSLGQRMRCELAGALLHRPAVIFLDEPTIGVDVPTQAAIRAFLLEYRTRHDAAVLLTSHHMADVAALADRVLIISHGRLEFDGDLDTLVRIHSRARAVQLRLERPVTAGELAGLGDAWTADGLQITVHVDRDRTKECAALALSRLPVLDLSITEPSVEEVLQSVLAKQRRSS